MLIAAYDGLVLQWLADKKSVDWQFSAETLTMENAEARSSTNVASYSSKGDHMTNEPIFQRIAIAYFSHSRKRVNYFQDWTAKHFPSLWSPILAQFCVTPVHAQL